MNPAQSPVVAAVLPGGEGFGPGGVGAIGLIVHRLAGAESGFRTVVLAPAGGVLFADRDVVAVRAWPFPGLFARARYPWAVLRALRRLRPALVEVHNRPALALFLAGRVSMPVVLVLHNDPWGMRRAHSAAERAVLLRRVAGVAVVSVFLRDRLLSGVTEAAPVVVVPNGIDLAGLPPALPAEAREPVVLFAGRTIREKGVDAFLRACDLALPELPGWRGVMIGSRDHTPEGDVLGPQARVDVLGWRPHAEVMAWMGRAAIVLMPSRWEEPFGLAALEAMAMGAALMASARGGLPEVTGDAAVPVDPEDPAKIAQALVALARDPARRAALAERGRARAAGFGVTASAVRLDTLRRLVLRG